MGKMASHGLRKDSVIMISISGTIQYSTFVIKIPYLNILFYEK